MVWYGLDESETGWAWEGAWPRPRAHRQMPKRIALGPTQLLNKCSPGWPCCAALQHQLQWSHQQTRAHLQNRFVMPSSSASGGWAAAAPGTRLAQLMHRRALSGRKGCW